MAAYGFEFVADGAQGVLPGVQLGSSGSGLPLQRSDPPHPTHSLPQCSALAKPCWCDGQVAVSRPRDSAQGASMWVICSVGIGCGGSLAQFLSRHRRAEYRIHTPASWPPCRVGAVADLGDLLTGTLRRYPKTGSGFHCPQLQSSDAATVWQCGAGMPSIQHSAPTILPCGATMLLPSPGMWEVTGCRLQPRTKSSADFSTSVMSAGQRWKVSMRPSHVPTCRRRFLPQPTIIVVRPT